MPTKLKFNEATGVLELIQSNRPYDDAVDDEAVAFNGEDIIFEVGSRGRFVCITNNCLGVDASIPGRFPLSLSEIGLYPKLSHPSNSIQFLELKNCGITDSGWKTLCQCMKGNDSITSLIGGDEFIGDASAKHLADMLCVNKTLTRLILYCSDFGNETAAYEHLSRALSQNSTLVYLHLGSMNTKEQMEVLCAGLAVNRGLERLYIEGRVEEGCFAPLERAMRTNYCLTNINWLVSSKIPDPGSPLEKICFCMELNRFGREIVFRKEEPHPSEWLKILLYLVDREEDYCHGTNVCVDLCEFPLYANAIYFFLRAKPELISKWKPSPESQDKKEKNEISTKENANGTSPILLSSPNKSQSNKSKVQEHHSLAAHVPDTQGPKVQPAAGNYYTGNPWKMGPGGKNLDQVYVRAALRCALANDAVEYAAVRHLLSDDEEE